jgi:hypothetical protein
MLPCGTGTVMGLSQCGATYAGVVPSCGINAQVSRHERLSCNFSFCSFFFLCEQKTFTCLFSSPTQRTMSRIFAVTVILALALSANAATQYEQVCLNKKEQPKQIVKLIK